LKKNKDKFLETEREKILKAAIITMCKPEGKIALDYLTDERKLSKKIIKQFDVGYCPQDIDHRLRGRIITPVYDEYKNLIILSTRHLDKTHPNRFWHESFEKKLYLYGLCYAKEFIIRYNRVIIVEGEFDVMALHSNGFPMTVGICGSALSLFQIALLSKYCSYFYFLFDGDEAGRDAMERAKGIYDKYYLNVYDIHFIPVYLPKDMDPDDAIKKYGSKKLKEKLKEAYDEYKILN